MVVKILIRSFIHLFLCLCSLFIFPSDYSCALQRDILLQGRLYLSENWICFYSNIFRWETLVRSHLLKHTLVLYS